MLRRIAGAYAGIDVAFAKGKRLPVAVCICHSGRLEPLPLRRLTDKPPKGAGNAKAIDIVTVERFAEETAAYLRQVERAQRVRIKTIAIDAPSDPKREGSARRECERCLDARRIQCITTPSASEFKTIRTRVTSHLAAGGAESSLPHANQLWMLVGFALFRRLRHDWECLEVFPQAIAAVLGAQRVHKARDSGVRTQLTAAARHTRWPDPPLVNRLSDMGFGSRHDRLDAYLAAWIASLEESRREALGKPPFDAIWIPKLQSETGLSGR